MWRVEYEPVAHLLLLSLADVVDARQARALAKAHASALEATGGERFRVLIDLRGVMPLDDETIAIVTDVKRVAAGLAGYRGRAVLVDSPTVAMQQRRSTIEDGPSDEVITTDPVEARAFLDSLR